MKKQDIGFILICLLLLSPFLPIPFLKGFQTEYLYNESQWIWTSFIKFAFLATLGEVIGLRIKTGNYTAKGFGLVPRALVWGGLGITIKLAFVVFATGVPVFAEKFLWIVGAKDSMASPDVLAAFDLGLGWQRILTAFLISALMNIIFAPVMMTFHKITDTHITDNGGTLSGFFKPIQFGSIFQRINWSVQWNFVFKKTIPFFWIPAHTITFLMPGEYRVVFAALLGIILGVFLSIASQKGTAK
ncbi:MAG: hypothetical protein CVU05_10495 [Bacteroidetes bacterium HGW-Bacteroidetes-21]|jgi:hypothetical protein|nr:MAG: hypothetical protein CVU05_10495 [Bacteroidetes bacterium HGW-Bacteroidetes-21]